MSLLPCCFWPVLAWLKYQHMGNWKQKRRWLQANVGPFNQHAISMNQLSLAFCIYKETKQSKVRHSDGFIYSYNRSIVYQSLLCCSVLCTQHQMHVCPSLTALLHHWQKITTMFVFFSHWLVYSYSRMASHFSYSNIRYIISLHSSYCKYHPFVIQYHFYSFINTERDRISCSTHLLLPFFLCLSHVCLVSHIHWGCIPARLCAPGYFADSVCSHTTFLS